MKRTLAFLLALLTVVLCGAAAFAEAEQQPEATADPMGVQQVDISDGSDPDDPVTREQLVTMLWRYCGKPAVDFDLSGFADRGGVSAYAVEAFRWAETPPLKASTT